MTSSFSFPHSIFYTAKHTILISLFFWAPQCQIIFQLKFHFLWVPYSNSLIFFNTTKQVLYVAMLMRFNAQQLSVMFFQVFSSHLPLSIAVSLWHDNLTSSLKNSFFLWRLMLFYSFMTIALSHYELIFLRLWCLDWMRLVKPLYCTSCT